MVAKNLIYSQNGEEGILIEIFERIGIDKGKCCEFGSADGYWCSNTRYFVDNGWEGLFYDAIHGDYITPGNVNEKVPQELDLLSIDIDGNDYDVWKAYTGDAKVVVIEINSGFPEDVEHKSLKEGTSFKTMNGLAKEKGYHLVYHTGNCIYVKNEYKNLFPEKAKFDKSWVK